MGDAMTDKERKNPRRATIMRGVVTPIFGLLAAALIFLGVLNATEWKPSAQIAATTATDTRYVVTDPGMLSLVDDQVTIDVTSESDAKLCVVSGLSRDISGWIAGHTYTRLTGLSSWTQISTEAAKASGDSQPQDGDVTLEQSDMWTGVVCGTGSVHIERPAESNTTPLLFDTNADAASNVTDGGKLNITLHWTRSTLPDYATPLYFIGGMCAVAAVLCASLFAMHPSKRRKKNANEPRTPIAEEIEVTIPHLVFGAIGSFFGSIASLLHIGGSKRHRRHARRAGTSIAPASERLSSGSLALGSLSSGLQPSGSQSDGPKVVDVTAKNMVAEQAAASGSSAGVPAPSFEVSSAETQAETVAAVAQADAAADGTKPAPARNAKPADADATSVISPADLAAYFALFAAEQAAEEGRGSGTKGLKGTEPEHNEGEE